MKTCEQTAAEELLADVFDERIKICFVCTGNTCRSPMAAAVLNHYGKNKGKYAESAGIFPNEGEPISENAKTALLEAGILPIPENDYQKHSARQVSEQLLKKFDIICGLTEAHAMTLISAFPSLASKITSLGKDISDPFGGDIELYKKCLAEITEALREDFSLYD